MQFTYKTKMYNCFMFLLNYCSKALYCIFSSHFPPLKFFVFMPKRCLLYVMFAPVPLQTFTAKTVYFKWKVIYFSHGGEQSASVPVYNKFLTIIVRIWLWETLIYSHAVSELPRRIWNTTINTLNILEKKNLPVQSHGIRITTNLNLQSLGSQL